MLPGKPWILHFTRPGLEKAWNLLTGIKEPGILEGNSKFIGSDLFLKQIFHSIY